MSSKAVSTHDLANDTDEIIGDEPIAKIVEVHRVDDEPTSLNATYANGTVVKADMAYHLRGHETLEEVAADPVLFAQVKPDESGGLEWPNGADISAEGVKHLGEVTAGRRMHRFDFRDWMKRNDLKIDNAGPKLGLSRKTIARYSSGATAIPQHILLACQGYDAAVAQGKPPSQILRPTGFKSETKFGTATVTHGETNMSRLRLRGDVVDKPEALARLWYVAIHDTVQASAQSGKEVVWSFATAPGEGDADLIVIYSGSETRGFEAVAKIAREFEEYIVE